MGTNSSIMTILKETSLGVFYFVIATILRDTILLSSMLLNIEVAFGLTASDMKKLEMTDRILLRRVLSTGRSTPVCSIFLELGLIPPSFIIKARKIMYLHYLLTLDQSQLLYKIFDAQRRSPVKNDWYIRVKSDLEEFGLIMDDDEIKIIKKATFKEQVKQACKQSAFNYLLKEKI